MNGENDTMYYVHKDYLGSYDVITDEDGNVLERLSFDPWGRRRNPTDWTFNHVPTSHLFDRGYTGHEHLDIFSLINMNGRVYDPWLGRFLSPDPFVQSPGYSQSFNRYSYCFNNPLKYSDPSGFNAWKLEENPIQTFGSSGDLGIFRINWNQNLSEAGSYSYDWWTGNYYNASGQEVSYNEVFVNYVQPNSISFNSYLSSIISDNIKHSQSQGNRQNPVNSKNLLADIRNVLLKQGNLMFDGTLELLLGLQDNPDQLTSEDLCMVFLKSCQEYYDLFAQGILEYYGPEEIELIADWIISNSELYPDSKYFDQFPSLQYSVAVINAMSIYNPVTSSYQFYPNLPEFVIPYEKEGYPYFSFSTYSTVLKYLHLEPVTMTINGNNYSFRIQWKIPEIIF